MNVNPEAEVLVFGKDNRAKATASRPLTTFALFAYNQEAFIRQAVEGALAQTYEPLEIILSDDCSSDLTFQHMVRMAKSYNGPHRIIVRRNASNSGLASHLNKVLELSAGQIIVLAAGDDISYPTRTATSVKLLGMDRSFASVLVSADIIDVKGNITGEALLSHEEACVQDVRDLLDLKAKTLGAARAFRSDVWQSFPPFQPLCPTEDTPMLLRTLIVGKSVLSSNKELAYRRHDSNLSGLNSLKSMDFREICDQYSIDIDHAYSLCMITPGLHAKLNHWVAGQVLSRDLQNRFLNTPNISNLEIWSILKSPALSLREKLMSVTLYLFCSLRKT